MPRTIYSKREAVAILSGKFCMLFDLYEDRREADRRSDRLDGRRESDIVVDAEVMASLFDQSAAILGWQ